MSERDDWSVRERTPEADWELLSAARRMNDGQFARFMAKVDASGECWEWTGALSRDGYGSFMLDGRRRPGRRAHAAHRVSYEHFVGPIAEGLQIDHQCRNTRCVNPKHLEAVTARVNGMRSNSASAKNRLKTHCPQDHEYTPENTRTHKGKRQCRVCHLAHEAAYRATHRAELAAKERDRIARKRAAA